MASRDLALLTPELREKYLLFKKNAATAGIQVIVTCTARNILEQMALYVQGRLSFSQVNKFRKAAGLHILKSQEQNRKVTWTLDSKHVTNNFDDDLKNDFSRAFDIVIISNRKAVWDIKADVNQNEIPDYEELGRIGESIGLVWGGRWNPPDYVHFQEDK